MTSFSGLYDAPMYVQSAILDTMMATAMDEKADDFERSEACLQICWAFIDGFGTAQDVPTARAWAQKAANYGSLLAATFLKLLYDMTGDIMDTVLQRHWTEWLEIATRRGLERARKELSLVDAHKCKLAEQPFQVNMGAKQQEENPFKLERFEIIDQLFHPRNRTNLLNKHEQARRAGSLGVFMTTERNTCLHAGAALGINLENFGSFASHIPYFIDTVDIFGNTALHVALRCGHAGHARELLNHGASAAVLNKLGQSPSHWLVYIGEPQDQSTLVPLLIQNHADLKCTANPSSIDLCDQLWCGGTPLHWAVETNMLELTEALLSEDADPEFVYNGYTPIDIAVNRNNADVLKALLKRAGNPPKSQLVCTGNEDTRPVKYISTESYLHLSVSSLLLHDRWIFHGKAWLQQLRQTIHVLQKFKLDIITPHSVMEAAVAANVWNSEIFHLLIDEGLDVSTEDKAEFWQRLMHKYISTATPRLILFMFEQYENYASLEKLSQPENLLFECAEGANSNIAVLEKVLQTGVNVDTRTGRGTPFIVAVLSRNYELATNLLDRGAGVQTYYTPSSLPGAEVNVLLDLMNSNMDLQLGPLKYLLEPLHPYTHKTPDFVVARECRFTALHAACRTGNVAIVQYILEKFPGKAQIDATSLDGWTALHYATYHGHLEVVRMLCQAGADVNVRMGRRDVPRRQHSTALDFCYFHTTPSEEEMGQLHGRQITKQDIHFNRMLIAEHLKEQNARKADSKRVALSGYLKFAYLAVGYQEPKVLAEALQRLQLGSITQPVLDALLFYACSQKDTAVTGLLISAGADINARSRTNNTPLHIATACKQPLNAQLLLQKGAEVNLLNDDEETPLEWAVYVQLPALLHVLKKACGLVAIKKKTILETWKEMDMEISNIESLPPMLAKIRIKGEPSDDEITEDENKEDKSDKESEVATHKVDEDSDRDGKDIELQSNVTFASENSSDEWETVEDDSSDSDKDKKW